MFPGCGAGSTDLKWPSFLAAKIAHTSFPGALLSRSPGLHTYLRTPACCPLPHPAPFCAPESAGRGAISPGRKPDSGCKPEGSLEAPLQRGSPTACPQTFSSEFLTRGLATTFSPNPSTASGKAAACSPGGGGRGETERDRSRERRQWGLEGKGGREGVERSREGVSGRLGWGRNGGKEVGEC